MKDKKINKDKEIKILKEKIRELEKSEIKRKQVEGILRTEKEFSEKLLETANAIVLTLDKDANIMTFNRFIENLTGYKKDEVLGKNWFELFIPKRNHSEIPKIFSEVIKELPEASSNTNPILCKNGAERLISWENTLLKDNNEKTSGILSIGIDITERKQSQEALEENEKRYRQIYQFSPDSIILHDMDMNILDANNKAVEEFGYSKVELLKTKVFELHPETELKHSAQVLDDMKKKDMLKVETKFVRKNGSVFVAEVTPCKYTFGSKPIIHVVIRDITEQKNAEKIQKTMLNISNALNKTENLDELFLKIREHLGKVIDTTNFYVALYDEKTNMISLPFLVDKKDDFKTFPAGKTLTAYVIKNGKPLLATNDVVKELTKKGIIKTIGTPSEIWMGVPLKIGKKVIGVIVVQNYDDPHDYTEKDIDILTFVSEEIALAIQHKQADEILKRSEERYRAVVEHSHDGVLIVGKDYKFIYVNDRLCEMLGYTREEIIGHDFREFLDEESRKVVAERYIKRQRLEIVPSRYEFNIVRKDSEKRHVEISSTVIKDSKGEMQTIAQILDITERKQSEEELKKHRDHLEELVKKRTLTLEKTTKEIKESQQALSLLLEDVNDLRDELQEKTNKLNISLKNIEDEKDKIDAILKSIGDGLIVTDLDNKIILMNQVVEDLLNIRLSEVLNKPLNFIFDKKLQEKFNFTIPEVEKGYQFDFEILSKKFKTPYIYNATASPIKDKKDKITGIITNFHDVTQEHRIDQMKTNFISTAAHELRTPLTAIQGFSEILNIRDDLDDADKKKFLNHINRQSINLGNIINDMLDISRIESGRGFSLKLEKCKINEEILRTWSAYEISYPNYLFYAYLPDKELEVFIDRGKIEQVMENLLSNAVKYSTQGSKIRIKGKISGNKYIVTVEDEGIGMSPKELSRVFEKFFRSDYSNTSIKGTGLGMSIVKHIIEAHKGKIWLESKLGQGTKAHFSIPIPLKKTN